MKNFEDNLTTNPRTGVLADFFEKTASGEFGEPDNTYLGDISLFKNDEKMSSFYLNHRKLQGQFDKHFYSSIPFIIRRRMSCWLSIKRLLRKKKRYTILICSWSC